jgi:hypothetical protein
MLPEGREGDFCGELSYATVFARALLDPDGAFGFLAKAHIGHQVEGERAVGARAAGIEARISVQADAVADLDRRIGQIDGAVEKSPPGAARTPRRSLSPPSVATGQS